MPVVVAFVTGGTAWQAGSTIRPAPRSIRIVAVIDVPGFVADLKSHAVDHQFHVHDERHFIETYSLRQMWEVELHPEQACGGPLDLHLALEVDPRALLQFEDQMVEASETDDPPTGYWFPMAFNWALPPLPAGPDLLVLATELAEIGGTELPLEVSAIDPCRSWPASRSRWTGSFWARSSCARCSTAAMP